MFFEIRDPGGKKFCQFPVISVSLTHPVGVFIIGLWDFLPIPSKVPNDLGDWMEMSAQKKLLGRPHKPSWVLTCHLIKQ